MLFKLSSPKFPILASLATVAVTGFFSSSAQAANFSIMGELHTKQNDFAIFNNGLLNHDWTAGSIELTDSNGVTKTYGRYDWNIYKVELDFTRGTASTTGETGIYISNLSNPNTSIVRQDYTSGHYNVDANPYKGSAWTATTTDTVGFDGNVIASQVTGNHAQFLTFNFNNTDFTPDKSIAFTLDYDKMGQTGTEVGGADMSNFRASVYYISNDGKWIDNLYYEAPILSGKKPSFPFDIQDDKIVDVEPGNAVLNPTSTTPPGTAVPEPLTMLGAATAAGLGAAFKRRLRKAAK